MRVVILLAAALGFAASASATTYYVNNQSGGCSDSGPGTLANPYCTLGAALAAHHDPGTTILVEPGTYREEIHVPGSGASGSPLVIQSDGPVTLDGADDFGRTALWSPAGGTTFLAASVTWAPVQVFADGRRLTPSTAPPGSMPAGSFQWVSGAGLYVNLGGDNPGGHTARVGHRPYGFYLGSRSWVTIQGFTVARAESRGIRANQSSDVEIARNIVTACAGYGILADSSTSIRILSNSVSENTNHGIGLTMHSSLCTVEGNESSDNAVPGVRAANGIYVYASSNNEIRNNRLHGNQDTGLQLDPGSNGNLSIQNRSWSNGDHGFDHLSATGNVHIGDVAYGNVKDGFSFEGGAVSNQLFDCIAAENGLTTNEFDLWVDGTSSAGFQSNDNLFWNSTAQAPVKYVATVYPSVSAYSAASGQDTRTIQADPRFLDPAHGDFHLSASSPAIDDANSSIGGWPVTDAEGNARVDEASVTNTGLGSVAFADRGALEFGGGGAAAVATAPPIPGAPPRVLPNPLRAAGHLAFSTARAGPLSVEILDVGGRLVRRIVSGAEAPAGAHVVALDGRRDDGQPLASGIYRVSIRSADGARQGRFVVMR